MADWQAFRHELENAPTRQPSIDTLRQRRRQRMQRKAIAGTFAVVMAGGATGVAILGEDARRGAPPPIAAGTIPELNRIVNGKQVAPPKDYKDYVVTDVDFVSPGTGWAIGLRCVGEACDVATWRTDDGGDSWSAPMEVASGVPRSSYHDEDPAGGGVRSLRMVDELTGYAFNPDLYVTRDGGRTWTRMPQPSKVASVSVENGSVWVLERGCAKDADCDLVLREGPVRQALTDLAVPETNGARALLRRASPKVAYLVAWDAPAEPRAAMHVTEDAGATWTQRLMPCADATSVVMTTTPAPAAQVMLVCSTDVTRTAWYSTNEGRSWLRLPDPPLDGTVTDFVGIEGRGAYLTTQEPGALYVLDGPTWRKADVARAYGYVNVDPTGPGTAVVMGDAGLLWRLRDGAWRRLALPPAGPRVAPEGLPRLRRWTGVSFVDAQRGYAIGHHCTASICTAITVQTTDGGNTWQTHYGPGVQWPPRPTHHAWRADRIAFADDTHGWYYGDGLWATQGGGSAPRQLRLGEPVEHLEIREGFVWVVSGTRVFHATVDAAELGPVRSQPDVGTVNDLVAVEAGTAYVVGSERVAGTTDGGNTWTTYDAPCPSATASSWGPGTLWLVCAGATAQAPQSQAVTNDGGRNWRITALPGTGTALGEIVALSDSVAWRTGANAGVLHTTNGGASWTPAPSVAGKAVSLTFVDRQHGWLVADDVLYRTTDGLTWTRIGRR